jgi:hypothetical protein
VTSTNQRHLTANTIAKPTTHARALGKPSMATPLGFASRMLIIQ